MIQLIDAVPLRAFDWAGYELTQHAQHAADVHADHLTTYGSYDVHDNELTGWVHLLDEADAVRIDTLAVATTSRFLELPVRMGSSRRADTNRPPWCRSPSRPQRPNQPHTSGLWVSGTKKQRTW